MRALDAEVANLCQYYEGRGTRVVVLSEYGIVPVDQPVHLNRAFRAAKWIAVREELGRESLDAGECGAFSVADHQIAHIYVKRPELLDAVRILVESVPGVAQVLDEEGKRAHHLDHPRSGDLIALAEPNAWFTYYWWLDDARAPDFARTVDIHRKPGYDPAELFLDPAMPFIKARIAGALLKKKLGFRYLMDVIPLDPTLVKGSHGVGTMPKDGPLLITPLPELLPATPLEATDVHDVILAHLTTL